MEDLLKKLEAIGDRFREVEKSIGDPQLIADNYEQLINDDEINIIIITIS